MKDIFKSALGTIIGIIGLSVILGLFSIVFISLIALASDDDKDASQIKANGSKDHQVLHLTFYNVPDRTSSGFEDINLFDLADLGNKKIGLTDYFKIIQKAKTDEKIKGIFLDLNYIWSSWANLEELKTVLEDFKSSGKFIVAYGDAINKKAYWLATVSDKIYLTPTGILDFNGLNATVTFYKKALEKLGVEVQVFKYGKFKSAVEPFILEKMSPANKKQVGELLGSIYDKFLADISDARGITSSDLDRMANELSVSSPKSTVDYGLIDALKYKDEVIQEMKLLAFGKDTSANIRMIKVQKMAKNIWQKQLLDSELKKKDDQVAVVYASGDIVMGSENEGVISSDYFAKAIKQAREDSAVKAIVLRINSPGGSALASDIIWRELILTKGVKPIIVSMGGVAASGGYYIACMADKIIANHNTITGSIGVFGMLPYTGDFMRDKIGLTYDRVNTTNYADLGDMNRKVSDYEAKVIQQGVNQIYEDFVDRVADGRASSFEKIHAVAEGRVWSGAQAKSIGLVDEIGGLNDAINAAKQAAGIEECLVVDYPKKKVQPWELLITSLDEEIKSAFIGDDMSAWLKDISNLKQWTTKKGVQTRMPFDIELN